MKGFICFVYFLIGVGSAIPFAQSIEELLREGKWAQAEDAFRRMEQSGSLDREQLGAAVQVSVRLNHWDRVVELLDNAGRQRPLTVSERVQLFEAEQRRGNAARAETLITGLIRDRPGDEQLVHQLAFFYLSRQRLREAAECYRRFLEGHPDTVESRINLALILFKAGGAEEAFSQLAQAFKIDFETANQHFYRQLVRNMAPDGLAELAEDTKRELGLPLDGPKASLYLGREFEALSRFEPAARAYQSYLRAVPADGDARFALANLFFQLGEFDSSEAEVSKLLRQGGAQEQAARLLAAELAVKKNDFQAASEQLAGVTGSLREQPLFAFLTARVALGEDRPAEAVPLLEALTRTTPEMVEAFFYLGQAYMRLGESEKGRAALQEYQRRKPN